MAGSTPAPDATPEPPADAVPDAAPPAASPPDAQSVPPPPPPPPPAPVAGGGSGRALMSWLDPQGIRPTAIVAGVILALFFGSQLLNGILPAAAQQGGIPVGPGSTVELGALRIHLVGGWQAVNGPVGPRLAKGSVAVDVQSGPFTGDPADLYAEFVNTQLAPFATGFGATQPSAITVGPGVRAARGAYTGVFGDAGEIEGEVTAMATGGTGYVFDAWGASGTLRSLLAEVQRMLETVEVVE